MEINGARTRNQFREESGIVQGLRSTSFSCFFWSASHRVSLTFRRHQRSIYSVYPFLYVLIEPLFERKVKEIPSWEKTIDANRVSRYYYTRFCRNNSSRQNALVKYFEGEASSYERRVFTHWTRSSLVCDPNEGQQGEGSRKAALRSPYRSVPAVDANAAENRQPISLDSCTALSRISFLSARFDRIWESRSLLTWC